MSLTSMARADFSAQLATHGESLTIAHRATEANSETDSAGRLIETDTQWASDVTYTGVFQSIDPLRNAADIAEFNRLGINLRHAAITYLRYDVDVVDGDKLTHDGVDYIVRFAPPARKGHRKTYCTRAGGLNING